MRLHYHIPQEQRSVWAKTAPSSHPVRAQQSLPLDAEGIGGPVIDHPCSSSGARPSSKPLLPKAAIHKWQQRPGLGAHSSALLARNWRSSGLCLPTAELTHTDSHSCVSSRTRMSQHPSFPSQLQPPGLGCLVSDKTGPPFFPSMRNQVVQLFTLNMC